MHVEPQLSEEDRVKCRQRFGALLRELIKPSRENALAEPAIQDVMEPAVDLANAPKHKHVRISHDMLTGLTEIVSFATNLVVGKSTFK